MSEPAAAVWAAPDPALLWVHDRMHFPDPVTPLSADMPTFEGFNDAALAAGRPVRMRRRRIHGYLYSAMAPAPAGTPAASPPAGRLREVWEQTWLPEIRRHHAWWDAFDLDTATPGALRDHLEESLVRYRRLWDIHFRLVGPAHDAVGAFDELYRELFSDAAPFDAYALLRGIPNSNLEADIDLWRLARAARQFPPVRAVLDTEGRADAQGVLKAIAGAEGGPAFAARLHAYLAEFGQRSERDDLAAPTWLDDPAPVLRALRDHLEQPERDLEAEQAALAAERDRRVGMLRERLRGYPGPVASRFEAALQAAEDGAYLSEEHNFWIDQRGAYRMRRVLLEAGRRLAAAGGLERADDVFLLTLDELRENLAAQGTIDRRGLALERGVEMVRARSLVPPPSLGTPPPAPSGGRADRFFGGPPPASAEAGVLRGAAGSPGVARGPVRLVRSSEDAAALQPGDVLVAETLLSTWTPLFTRAIAVVTDTGGILCHAACVAREHRLPAVVGAGRATAMLRDGQLVEVDGAAGTVHLLHPA